MSKPVHPESAMSGDEGKRAETTAEIARAVDKGLKDREAEKGRGKVTGKPCVIRHFIDGTHDRREFKRGKWGSESELAVRGVCQGC